MIIFFIEFVLIVHRHCRHHYHGLRLQRVGHPQHLDVPAQDENCQLPSGLKIISTLLNGHCDPFQGIKSSLGFVNKKLFVVSFHFELQPPYTICPWLGTR